MCLEFVSRLRLLTAKWYRVNKSCISIYPTIITDDTLLNLAQNLNTDLHISVVLLVQNFRGLFFFI